MQAEEMQNHTQSISISVYPDVPSLISRLGVNIPGEQRQQFYKRQLEKIPKAAIVSHTFAFCGAHCSLHSHDAV
jgi:hypothetical protein